MHIMQFTRRRMLECTVASAAGCVIARLNLANESPFAGPIVDTHVYVGNWPHKRLNSEEPSELVAKLRRNNVSQAWIGSFDGVFHKDIGGVNQRLADTCAQAAGGMLVPFGTINPVLPDWEEDIRRCHETFHMPGVRLHPNYHGYTLDDPRFARLLELAAAGGLIVQLVAWIEDERHVFLSPHAAQVELKPLAEKVVPYRDLRVVLANGYHAAKDESLNALFPLKQIYFDTARAADAKAVRGLIEKTSPDRVVFGTCSPLHNFDGALTTLQQAQLSAADWQAVVAKNSRGLMATKNTKNDKNARATQPQ